MPITGNGCARVLPRVGRRHGPAAEPGARSSAGRHCRLDGLRHKSPPECHRRISARAICCRENRDAGLGALARRGRGAPIATLSSSGGRSSDRASPRPPAVGGQTSAPRVGGWSDPAAGVVGPRPQGSLDARPGVRQSCVGHPLEQPLGAQTTESVLACYGYRAYARVAGARGVGGPTERVGGPTEPPGVGGWSDALVASPGWWVLGPDHIGAPRPRGANAPNPAAPQGQIS